MVVLLLQPLHWGTESQAELSLITQANKVLSFYKRLKPKPANDLLSLEAYEQYRLALANKQCQRAEDILMLAFLLQYPNKPPVEGREEIRAAWYAAVGTTIYPDLVFCLAKENVHEGLAEIARDKIKADLYPYSIYGRGQTVSSYPPQIKKRDLGILYLSGLVSVGFDPAQFELARLGHQGGIVSLYPGFKYFVFARAKHLIIKTPKLEQMLQDAAKALTRIEVNRLQEKAKSGPWDSLAILYKK